MKFKKPQDELSKLLGTGDREEQVAQVKRLKAAPIIDVVIRVDGRVDQVTGVHVLGGTIPPAVFYKVLDQVRDQVHQAELQMAAQNGKPAPPPAPEPPAPEEAN
jgi:hypothetical protein